MVIKLSELFEFAKNIKQILFYHWYIFLLLTIVIFIIIKLLPSSITNHIPLCLLIVTILFLTLFVLNTLFSVFLKESHFYNFYIYLVIVALLFYVLYYTSATQSFTFNLILLFINACLFIVGVSFLLTLFKSTKYAKSSQAGKIQSIFQLIKDVILYLPCLFISLIERIKYEYHITTKTSLIILCIEIILLFLNYIIPKLYRYFIIQDGLQLLKDPIYLNDEKQLGTFESLHPNATDTSYQYAYNYAISSWIFIDNQPPSTSSSFDVDILNYGHKPQISYNVAENKLNFNIMRKLVYTMRPVHQKWIHLLINYQGGTLDIFIDGKLESSTPNIVPYMSYDNFMIGKENGINGGIKNVIYFDHYLKLNDINILYNTQK